MKKSKRGLWILGFLCVMVSGIVLSNSKSRAKTVIYPTVASGEQVKESNNCVIDYSNTADGYVMVKFKALLITKRGILFHHIMITVYHI